MIKANSGNVTLFTPLQLTPSEEAFLRNYAGVVHSQMSQLPQHNIDQGKTVTHTHSHAGTHTLTRSKCSYPARVITVGISFVFIQNSFTFASV